MCGTLPEPFKGWFAERRWEPRQHQLEMLDAARAGESILLVAPTGGGKTFVGFPPGLVELTEAPREGLHTLYVSPLKAPVTDGWSRWRRFCVGLDCRRRSPVRRRSAHLPPAGRIISVADGAPASLSVMLPTGRLPRGGQMGLEAAPQVMTRIRAARMTIVFVNRRAQAELMFQAPWRLDDPMIPIGLHHGSLEIDQRRKVEAAMAAGGSRAVVATSSLDLGIDWGSVD
jgi:Lhr-like helicase